MTISYALNQIIQVVCKQEDGYFVKDINNSPVLILPMTLKGGKQKETRCFISVHSDRISLSLGHLSNSSFSCVLCDVKDSFSCDYEKHAEEVINFLKQKESFQQTLQHFRINAVLKGINVQSLLLKKENTNEKVD